MHHGYKCDSCGMDPIVGTRWECIDCPQEYKVDLCDNCKPLQFVNTIHQIDHNLVPIENSSINSEDYIYLDPNYDP
jgi:hypothetical protein